ncbi:OmpA family protein [Hyalangium minutum]|uniref:Peptidoglycan-associated lipoprotein n=1 Tax=Hyalangium minutum TaxID=394096 RepID=A0A085WNW8_9BACT|nr:OmpA family protein [Hyalangium minutum]KFE69381.1 outer membrane lipoprotein [Hyalangium minutum]
MRSYLLPLVLLAIGASACATKTAATTSTEGVSSVDTSPRPGPVKPAPAPAPVAELSPLDFGPIYYELDSATLRADSREMLERAAEALRKRPEARVTISGHTCELGTTEYNLALGQRRAASARDYMVKLGVEPARIGLVSYGEERPAEQGTGESVWSKNRRSEFTVTVAHARAGTP